MTPGDRRIAAPNGFARLRDNAQADERFEAEVFAPLAAAGLTRDDLQLAFSFTTASRTNTHTDLLRVRDLTLAWLDGNPVSVEITKIDEPDTGSVWRRLDGRVIAPLFLDDDGREATLVRGDDGTPRLSDRTEVPFTVLVPTSVRDRAGPGRAIVHGHGFFGSRADVDRPRMTAVAQATEAVLFSIDWLDFALSNLFVFTDVLTTHPADTPDVSDRLLQAIADRLVLARAIRTTMTSLPELQRPAAGPGVTTSSTGATNAGQPLFDPSSIYLLGTSAGGIHGTAVAALSPDIDRVCLNVTGGSFSQMMFRSQPFKALLLFLSEAVPDPLDQQKFAVLQQSHFDRTEAISWGAVAASQDNLQILLQVGLGDIWVPNMGSFLLARAMGLPLLTPAPVEVYGLVTQPAPISVSAVTLFDFGIDPTVYDRPDLEAPDNPVHNGVLQLDAAIEQVGAFFRDDGVIQ